MKFYLTRIKNKDMHNSLKHKLNFEFKLSPEILRFSRYFLVMKI